MGVGVGVLRVGVGVGVRGDSSDGGCGDEIASDLVRMAPIRGRVVGPRTSTGVGCELGTVIVGEVGGRLVVSSGSCSISNPCCGAGGSYLLVVPCDPGSDCEVNRLVVVLLCK